MFQGYKCTFQTRRMQPYFSPKLQEVFLIFLSFKINVHIQVQKNISSDKALRWDFICNRKESIIKKRKIEYRKGGYEFL